uniref:Uncharacterized protein n=2 Tax=Oryza sativa subsp. japonica TaxID=39947 RepID=Q2QVB6_ORYSJ|nr:hypothetical protein LOC_Os12g13370 [Oryza sativa Japonica Group]
MIPVPIPAAAIPVPSRAPFHVPVGSRPDDNSSCRKLYEPRLVAIRPYHHGRDELHAMEQHKWRFLQRAPTVPLSDFVDAMLPMAAISSPLPCGDDTSELSAESKCAMHSAAAGTIITICSAATAHGGIIIIVPYAATAGSNAPAPVPAPDEEVKEEK